MTTKVLREPEDVEKLSRFLSARTKWPITVSIVQGASRTDAANRLAQRWNADISRQLGDMSFEEVRAMNKLVFGIPAALPAGSKVPGAVRPRSRPAGLRTAPRGHPDIRYPSNEDAQGQAYVRVYGCGASVLDEQGRLAD